MINCNTKTGLETVKSSPNLMIHQEELLDLDTLPNQIDNTTNKSQASRSNSNHIIKNSIRVNIGCNKK
jgi:hypothetical protein